jgi:hypothetical protein
MLLTKFFNFCCIEVPMNRFHILSAAFVALSLASAPCAFADTVTYADITSATNSLVTGTVAGIGFTISGPTTFVQLSGQGDTNYFTDGGRVSPGTVYVGGDIGNAPNDGAIVAIAQAGASYTITFDSAVSNLVFAEVSLGPGPGQDVTYTFDQTFHVETCGTGYWGGGCFDGEPVGTNSTVMSGNESSGSVEFGETFTTLSFTVGPVSENWNGFDIGLHPQVAPVIPEPSSIALLGTGLFGLVGVVRRKLRS